MNRSNTVIVALAAAMLIPRVQKWTGVTMTTDDVAALMASALALFHGGAAFLERYYPPKESKSV